MTDATAMAHALTLARLGLGRTSPNPSVGAVLLAADGRVLGEGTTERAGGRHAEIVALHDARDRGHDVVGATLVVTLEPCCHHGRTPPCTDAVIAAGIGRVVIGMRDPFPKVDGLGVAALKSAGLEVVEGCEAGACARQILGFAKALRLGLPEVTAKVAMSLDGHLATATGESQWITGPEARAHGRQLRRSHDAILVGMGTVLADDPQLTVRDGSGLDPVPVVLDTHLRIPSDRRLFAGGRALVVTTQAAQPRAIPGEVVRVDALNGRVDAAAALRALVDRGMHRVLVEGGGEVLRSLFDQGLVDTLQLYVSGALLPGGRPWLAGPALESLSGATRLQLADAVRIGDDLCTTWHAHGER
jgi:diaminohydroxyphosphoribosylaminopyrimidine deaminase / 5-amino-6-(5-phosphoribosylamino)uracil reductase